MKLLTVEKLNNFFKAIKEIFASKEDNVFNKCINRKHK